MKKLGLFLALAPSLALAGPYAAHGVTTADTAFTGWATGVASLTRGLNDIANPAHGAAFYGTATNALGAKDGSVVSLGDGGSITLSFATPIANGAGADFAVFENGFAYNGGVFAELGYVSVSSDGVNFFTMPSVSLTPTTTQIDAFSVIDPTNVHNLAGQFGGGEGTPFDLGDLIGVSSLLNVDAIRFVRVTDVVGDLDPAYARYDSQGHIINDPYKTDYYDSSGSGGFDLDAVGVIHSANPVPEPATLGALALGLLAVRRRRR